MAKINTNLIKDLLKNAPAIKECYIGDDTLKGFGIRVQGNTISYVFKYRNKFKRQRTYAIGKVPNLTPDEARRIAKEHIQPLIAKGDDPADMKKADRRSMTVIELCQIYMEEGITNKKPSTIINDRSRINRHITPLIGNIPVKELKTSQIDKMVFDISNGKTAFKAKSDKLRGMINVTGGKPTAKRVLETLSSILEFAKRRGTITVNPALGIPKPKTNSRKAFLTIEDIKTFGDILRLPEYTLKPHYISAIKLLLLTGCRKNEILSLRWEYIDFKYQCLRLPDTKTGAQIRAFGIPALQIINSIHKQKDSPRTGWVFPASKGDGHVIGLPKFFAKLTANHTSENNPLKTLPKDISLHNLRHTFASIGAEMGYIELTLAGLLGHKLGGVTNRYSHLVDDSLVKAADSISLKISKALNNQEENDNIINISREA